MGCSQSVQRQSPQTLTNQLDGQRDQSSGGRQQLTSSGASSSSSTSKMITDCTTNDSLECGTFDDGQLRARPSWSHKFCMSFQRIGSSRNSQNSKRPISLIKSSPKNRQPQNGGEKQQDDGRTDSISGQKHQHEWVQVKSIDDLRPNSLSAFRHDLAMDEIDAGYESCHKTNCEEFIAHRSRSMGTDSKGRSKSFHDFYATGNVLGVGSFSEVLSCVNRHTQQKFAVKIMKKTIKSNSDQQCIEVDLSKMFYNETNVLRALSHRNIVSLIDVFEGSTSLYSVLEFCDSGDLFCYILKHAKDQRIRHKRRQQHQKLREHVSQIIQDNDLNKAPSNNHDIEHKCVKSILPRHGLDERQIIQVTRSIMDVLKYMHSHRCVHRDIKAQNFLFTSFPSRYDASTASGYILDPLQRRSHRLHSTTKSTGQPSDHLPIPSHVPSHVTHRDLDSTSPPSTSTASSSNSSRGRSNSNLSILSTEATTGSMGGFNRKSSSLICDNKRLVLIDFGMSVFLPENEYLTVLCGSPHYVAPEIIQQRYGLEVDIWAAGVIVYLLIYGRYPFDGEFRGDILTKIQTSKPSFPSNIAGPSKLAIDFLSRCLTRDPSERITATEALLHPWLQDEYFDSLLQNEECAYPLVNLTSEFSE